MEIRSEEKRITFEKDTLRFVDLSFDYQQNGGSEAKVTAQKITGVDAEEPRYLKYGYGFIRLVNSDSKPLPSDMTARYEAGRGDVLGVSLNKKQWESAQPLLEKIESVIQEHGYILLLDLTENSFPAPKIKATKIDPEWNDIKAIVGEALQNTPVTGYFIIGIDRTDIYIQGGWNSPHRIYLEASNVEGDKNLTAKLAEAGWKTPSEKSDFPNSTLEVFWDASEVGNVANHIVNTFSWVYDLEATSIELSVNVQDND